MHVCHSFLFSDSKRIDEVFGCGEAKIVETIGKDGVYSFDHVAINENAWDVQQDKQQGVVHVLVIIARTIA
jgi:hypothetical protein